MRYSRSRFETMVEDAWETIPESIRSEFSNLVIAVEDEPSEDQLERAGIPRGDTLLGLYEGVPLDKRGWFYQMALPDRITLFQGRLSVAEAETCSRQFTRRSGMNWPTTSG